MLYSTMPSASASLHPFHSVQKVEVGNRQQCAMGPPLPPCRGSPVTGKWSSTSSSFLAARLSELCQIGRKTNQKERGGRRLLMPPRCICPRVARRVASTTEIARRGDYESACPRDEFRGSMKRTTPSTLDMGKLPCPACKSVKVGSKGMHKVSSI